MDHHHHHHLFLNCPFLNAQLGLDVPPEMKPLHISLNTAHSAYKPSTLTFIPSLPPSTHTSYPRPFLQADTQSSPLLRFTCPNHLDLHRLTTAWNEYFNTSVLTSLWIANKYSLCIVCMNMKYKGNHFTCRCSIVFTNIYHHLRFLDIVEITATNVRYISTAV